jgi:hypothetical protein
MFHKRRAAAMADWNQLEDLRWLRNLRTTLERAGGPAFAMLRSSLKLAIPAIDDGKFDDLLRRLDNRSGTASQF